MSSISNLNFEDLDRYLKAQEGKIIHQVWFGTIPNKKEAKKYYDKLKKCRDSWRIKNPNWCVVEWNKGMCINLIRHHYPEHEDMFKNYQYQIQQCDSIRYFILHRYGGLYADMDYYCNRPWEEVKKDFQKDFYLVQTPNREGEYTSNSLMFSKPNHKFWPHLFLELQKSQTMPYYYTRHMTIMFSTGPGVLNRVYTRYKFKLKLCSYPAKLFHPYGISDDILSLNQNKKVYAIHLGKGSWEKKDSKVFLFFFREWKFVLFLLFVFLIPFLVYLFS